MDFPSYSPDLNPIENLWADLKRRIELHNCRTVDELKQVIEDEWFKTSDELCARLVDSMPIRCKAVITNHGFKTKY